MSKRRVVITGLGMVSPLGLDVASSWSAVVAGRSGIQPITQFDVSAFSVRFGGAVKGFDVGQYMSAKEARKMDPCLISFMIDSSSLNNLVVEPESLESVDEVWNKALVTSFSLH